MVRMNRAIGPFCRAKTCSTAARTADLRVLARAVRRGIGLPLSFLRMVARERHVWLAGLPSARRLAETGMEDSDGG